MYPVNIQPQVCNFQKSSPHLSLLVDPLVLKQNPNRYVYTSECEKYNIHLTVFHTPE